MINSVTNSIAVPPSGSGNSSPSSPITFHTPFGEVMVDKLTEPNLLAEFGGRPAATSDGGVTTAASATTAATTLAATANAQAAITANSTAAATSNTTAPSTAQAATNSSAAAE